jgi:hypothetical protein
MIPGSLVGAVFLIALVPGAVFLKRTDGKRTPTGDATALEELVTLVIAGTATVLPPILGALVAFPGRVRKVAHASNHFDTASEAQLRGFGASLGVLLLTALALAVLYSWVFNAYSEVDAAPDVWGPSLAADREPGQVLMVALKLRDGTFVQGASGGYSAGKNGRDRDLLLRWPIAVQLPEQEALENRRRLRRFIVSESQILYYTTQHMALPDHASVTRPPQHLFGWPPGTWTAVREAVGSLIRSVMGRS